MSAKDLSLINHFKILFSFRNFALKNILKEKRTHQNGKNPLEWRITSNNMEKTIQLTKEYSIVDDYEDLEKQFYQYRTT